MNSNSNSSSTSKSRIHCHQTKQTSSSNCALPCLFTIRCQSSQNSQAGGQARREPNAHKTSIPVVCAEFMHKTNCKSCSRSRVIAALIFGCEFMDRCFYTQNPIDILTEGDKVIYGPLSLLRGDKV